MGYKNRYNNGYDKRNSGNRRTFIFIGVALFFLFLFLYMRRGGSKEKTTLPEKPSHINDAKEKKVILDSKRIPVGKPSDKHTDMKMGIDTLKDTKITNSAQGKLNVDVGPKDLPVKSFDDHQVDSKFDFNKDKHYNDLINEKRDAQDKTNHMGEIGVEKPLRRNQHRERKEELLVNSRDQPPVEQIVRMSPVDQPPAAAANPPGQNPNSNNQQQYARMKQREQRPTFNQQQNQGSPQLNQFQQNQQQNFQANQQQDFQANQQQDFQANQQQDFQANQQQNFQANQNYQVNQQQNSQGNQQQNFQANQQQDFQASQQNYPVNQQSPQFNQQQNQPIVQYQQNPVPVQQQNFQLSQQQLNQPSNQQQNTWLNQQNNSPVNQQQYAPIFQQNPAPNQQQYVQQNYQFDQQQQNPALNQQNAPQRNSQLNGQLNQAQPPSAPQNRQPPAANNFDYQQPVPQANHRQLPPSVVVGQSNYQRQIGNPNNYAQAPQAIDHAAPAVFVPGADNQQNRQFQNPQQNGQFQQQNGQFQQQNGQFQQQNGQYQQLHGKFQQQLHEDHHIQRAQNALDIDHKEPPPLKIPVLGDPNNPGKELDHMALISHRIHGDRRFPHRREM